MEIKIKINSCRQCPHFKITDVSSTDGWDIGEDWKCLKADKMIATFVEWNEKNKIEIPNWCPCKLK